LNEEHPAQSADIDLDLAALVESSRKETSRPTRNLKRIVVAAADQIAGVDHAGITVVPHRGVIRSLAASDGDVLVTDDIQQRCLQGPCFELPRDEPVCRVDDAANESRWPLFIHELVSRTPIRALLSIELSSHAEGGAALNLYADRAHAFSTETEDVARTFAAHAGLAIELGRQQVALRDGPLDRDVIGQATGVLMKRFEMDAPAALTLLIQLSEKYREMLPLVASRVLASGIPESNEPG
jgi:GAF domain-containing protein